MSSMLNCNGALAVFVKTPGLSPIKTRLAAGIGEKNALDFYFLAIKAMKAMMNKLKDEFPQLTLYFAVAEKEGLTSKYWDGFQVIWQGDGGLGKRLANVYDQLLTEHNFVCFMGADSPHISFHNIYKAILATDNCAPSDFVLGETEDGGFYFFGGGLPIQHSNWESVTYSSNTTAKELRRELDLIAPIRELVIQFDVDTIEDIAKFRDESFGLFNLINEQRDIIYWARNLSEKTNFAS